VSVEEFVVACVYVCVLQEREPMGLHTLLQNRGALMVLFTIGMIIVLPRLLNNMGKYMSECVFMRVCVLCV